MLKYILARLQEPSTFASLSLLLGGLGLHIPDVKFQAVTHAVAGVAALTGVFMAEKSSQ